MIREIKSTEGLEVQCIEGPCDPQHCKNSMAQVFPCILAGLKCLLTEELNEDMSKNVPVS